jgi:hypothetical protein
MRFQGQRFTAIAVSVLAALSTGAAPAAAGAHEWTRVGGVEGNVLGVAVDPVRPATLYAIASQVPFIGVPATLYRSVDAGATWEVASTAIGASLSCVIVEGIAIDPRSPRTLYLVFDGDTGIGCHDDEGPFAIKSTDGGKTWDFAFGPESVAPAGINTFTLTGVVVDPTDSSRLYALSGDNVGLPGNAPLWKSENGGAAWEDVSHGLPAGDGANAPGFHVLSLVVDPTAPSRLLATGDDGNVYYTVNGGRSWRLRGAVPAANAGDPVGLFLDPQRPAIVYAYVNASGELFRSLDGARTWSPLAPGLPGAVASVAVVPRSPEKIYAATANGLFELTLGRALAP